MLCRVSSSLNAALDRFVLTLVGGLSAGQPIGLKGTIQLAGLCTNRAAVPNCIHIHHKPRWNGSVPGQQRSDWLFGPVGRSVAKHSCSFHMLTRLCTVKRHGEGLVVGQGGSDQLSKTGRTRFLCVPGVAQSGEAHRHKFFSQSSPNLNTRWHCQASSFWHVLRTAPVLSLSL